MLKTRRRKQGTQYRTLHKHPQSHKYLPLFYKNGRLRTQIVFIFPSLNLQGEIVLKLVLRGFLRALNDVLVRGAAKNS